jgi:hypothetical protein
MPVRIIMEGLSQVRGSLSSTQVRVVSLSIFKDNDYYSQIKPFVMNLASSFYCMIHFNKGDKK